jgi:asparagine synthase (glutamine-hydrolysing)
MCGICGAFDLVGRRSFDRQALVRMAHSLRHRGPDDAYSFLRPGIALATQRLALVDPQHGRQPLSDPCEHIVVSQNGELFNTPELRTELMKKGYSFRTRCDTEIWPSLFLSEHTNAFQRAHGQFAVALWDSRSHELFLARDRIGICPLYYTISDGFLLWASEIKALLASGLVTPSVDLCGIDQVFSLFAAGTRRTAFRNVFSLWPGHYLHAKTGQHTLHRYWDLTFPNQGDERQGTDSTLAEELAECLTQAVAKRLPSDVPIANLLSGGLDSTLLTKITCDLLPKQKTTCFTVGFQEAHFDESTRTKTHAAMLGVPLKDKLHSPSLAMLSLG